MKTNVCAMSIAAAVDKLPSTTDDKSGIGVHYVDAYLKPMNAKLADGTPVKCKRRGLKIPLSVGTKKGEGLMRRLAVGNDPIVMLDAALQEAATAAGSADDRRRRDPDRGGAVSAGGRPDYRPRARILMSTIFRPVALAIASWQSSAETKVVHIVRCEAATCRNSGSASAFWRCKPATAPMHW